ncbi:MAG: hypothetical protein O7G30_14525 [Proteobacteria bacterium]|nr:hypothetical protein [Pseudomonadota bacterium]
MRAVSLLSALGPIDARSVSRDSFLKWVLLIPLVVLVLLRFGVPELSGWLEREHAFDLRPYYPLVASYLVVLFTPLLVGTVLGFLLLDERDDDTLTALLVTPVSLNGYLLYRLGVPIAVCLAANLAALPLTGLVELGWSRIVPIAAIAAVEAPIVALFLASVAQNKVQGFAWSKLVSGVQALPLLAWFVEAPWQYAAGVVPGYWPAAAFWAASAGDDASFAGFLAVGAAVHAAVLWALLRHFRTVMHR